MKQCDCDERMCDCTPTPSDEVEKKLAEELGLHLDDPRLIVQCFESKLWRALVSERKRTELLDAMVRAYEGICGKSHATLRTLVSNKKGTPDAR
jgi:hypothetical protein